MDLSLLERGLDLSRRRKRWLLAIAAAGFTGYGLYRVYHLPSVSRRRRRFYKLFHALVAAAEAVSDSAEAVGAVSKDLNQFLRSDSDEVPNSLKQLSKIARSDEFSESLTRITESLTVGVIRGVRRSDGGEDRPTDGGRSFTDRVLDRLFSTAGSGFASVVVGSFARSLVLAFYAADGGADSDARSPSDRGWVDVICSERPRELIADCIRLFVSTAVAVYLDRTMNINTYDELFSGLTNPKHESKVKDVLVSVCNGAVETLVKTSHKSFTTAPTHPKPSTDSDADERGERELCVIRPMGSGDGGGWVDKVSSTLAVPGNRRFLIDVTGRVTLETVRTLLDFFMWRVCDSVKTRGSVVRREVYERGLEVVGYITAKSMVIVTLCLSLCLHVLAGTRVAMLA
ncbi:Protein PHLOEM PROTEIN 2-LIKE A10 [Acorus gramineus]|uniref:Protein PHLOEM PROTEIN 2-LIKE A10 n=1 Tax=Acorus gramineus TaxID=55184 RepID=A0AAV9AV86_ACOGR|nr:Protein PHLOEM PROTEIN 2-LIKE A10 [Acorus gramineus]KAK1269613.1 Protein PHLOEM PROTEIN 2-LIKE A10 [Acorus gramineus]